MKYRVTVVIIAIKIACVFILFIFLLSACDVQHQPLQDEHIVYDEKCPHSEVMIGRQFETDGIWCARIEIPEGSND